MSHFLRTRPATTETMLAAFDDAATLRHALAFEAELARAEAAEGLIDTAEAEAIAGLCAGSFRDEAPPSASHEWSGVLMLHDCAGGAYDLELISTERLIREHPGLLAA